MTWIILIITTVVSIVAFSNRELQHRYLFNPYQIHHRKQHYRWFSHALIHANWEHLIFNMITLFFFGRYVEEIYKYYFGNKGILFFIILYLGGILVSSLPSYFKHKDNHYYNSLGASGAVSAVLFSSILFDPYSMILVFFIPVPAILFGIVYLVYSAYMSKRNVDNIGHDAHFWGAVFGFVLPIILNPEILLIFIRKTFYFFN